MTEILLYEQIGGGLAGRIKSKLAGAGRVHLRIHSPGGSVFEGWAVYNALLAHKPGVEVTVDGYAASMASLIMLTGSKVRIAKQAMVMIHNPSSGGSGDAADLRRAADLLDSIKNSMLDAYAARARGKLSRAELARMMDDETWFDAKAAVAMGFADEVVQNPSAILAQFDPSAFRKQPPSPTFNMPAPDSIAACLEDFSARSKPLILAADKWGCTFPEPPKFDGMDISAVRAATAENLAALKLASEGKTMTIEKRLKDIAWERSELASRVAVIDQNLKLYGANGPAQLTMPRVVSPREELRIKEQNLITFRAHVEKIVSAYPAHVTAMPLSEWQRLGISKQLELISQNTMNTPKSLTREEWGKLSQPEQLAFFQAGGRLAVPQAGGHITAADYEASVDARVPKMAASEFRKMKPEAQAAFCKDGGKVVEDPKKEVLPPPGTLTVEGFQRAKADAKTKDAEIQRQRTELKIEGFVEATKAAINGQEMIVSEWRSLSPADQSAFFKAGGKLIDDPKQ